MRRTLFVGRFQPPHLGHKAMFDQALPSKPLIFVRPMQRDLDNPYTVAQVVEMLKAMMPDAIVDVLPVDIEKIAYGREVGYKVEDFTPKLGDVSPISATEIRRRIAKGEPVAGLVHPQVEPILRRIFETQ